MKKIAVVVCLVAVLGSGVALASHLDPYTFEVQFKGHSGFHQIEAPQGWCLVIRKVNGNFNVSVKDRQGDTRYKLFQVVSVGHDGPEVLCRHRG